MQKLSTKGLVVMSIALMVSHFGVGNFIFPAQLGQLTGRSWFLGVLGFTTVEALLPILAYLCVAKAQDDIRYIAGKIIHPKFGLIFGSIMMLIIGPVFIFPRLATSTHEMAVMPLFSGVPAFVTYLVFFGIVFYFSMNPSKVIDKLGSILAPLLITFVALLVFKGVFNPISTPTVSQVSSPYATGFTTAYNTMDAIGAMLFGGFWLADLKRRGMTEPKEQSKGIIKIGLMAMILLALLHGSIVYLGASGGSELAGLSIGEIPVAITTKLFGSAGITIFAFLLTLANLTTCVGIAATFANYFKNASNGKLQYTPLVIAGILVGFVLSNVGLSKIVGLTVPWLFLVYPALIVIILGTLAGPLYKTRGALAGGVIMALIVGAMDALQVAGFNIPVIASMQKMLPFAASGFSWIVPTIIGIVIGAVIYRKPQKEALAGQDMGW